jgi:hypothetical protein
VTRNRFVLLSVGVVVVAFAIGLALGLSSGSSSGGTPTSAPTPTATATATQPLDLPSALVRDCTGSGTAATCVPVAGGVDEVLVKQWPDAAGMLADFARTQGSKPDGKCGSYSGTPASGLPSTWGGGKPLACYVNSNGAAVVMWEDPTTRLQLLAVRKDGDTRAAFAWWTEAVKIPL